MIMAVCRRLDVLQKTAEEIRKETNGVCEAFQMDIRKPDMISQVWCALSSILGSWLKTRIKLAILLSPYKSALATNAPIKQPALGEKLVSRKSYQPEKSRSNDYSPLSGEASYRCIMII